MALPARTLNVRRSARLATPRQSLVDPLRIHELVHAPPSMPDPIEFCLSDKYLHRGNLYPRQATVLKVMFLRDDMFTQYDFDVIGEWEQTFLRSGNEGISPQVLQRIAINKAAGRPWFRENLMVLGRRGSKGHIGGLSGAYILWHYMNKPGGPQKFYGIDRDKRLSAIVFAGKKEQAVANQWRDLNNVIVGGPCFTPYLSKAQTERLTVYAPADILRAQRQMMAGVTTEADNATFEIVPSASTMMAGRGPTSFMQCLAPETKVLTTDLRWVPIGGLSVGDHLIAPDEFPDGGQRKLRDAEVEAVWRTRKEALRLTFEDGSTVVCSPDHRWLARDMGKGGSTHWRTAARLTPGNHIKHVVDPWEEDRSWDGGYLAGVYDGEGCISGYRKRAGKNVLFAQNTGAVLDQTLRLLREKGFSPMPANHHSFRNDGSGCQQWSLGGTAESMAFLGSVRPTRLMGKSRQVWEGVAPRGGVTPSGRARPNSYKTIVSVEHLPEQELVDITTSTKTFLAEGLVSHNCYDEMAHVVATGSNRDAESIYTSATPSLDQFGVDAFLYEGSSPWQMQGQFYENWTKAIEIGVDGLPSYPEMLMLQLPSWGPYEDWEEADRIPIRPPKKVYIEVEVQIPASISDTQEVVPASVRTEVVERMIPGQTLNPLKRAIQTYDDQMKQLEKANPQTFAVERRSHWSESMSSYLDRRKIDEMFGPYKGALLRIGTGGSLSVTYKAHGDPAKVNDNFGFAIAHIEAGNAATNHLPHVVFDVLHHWRPQDFKDNTIDYLMIQEQMERYVESFVIDELTFDQFNSIMTIGSLNKFVQERGFPKRISIYEKTATRPLNWKRAEIFKAAINLGLVHAPMLDTLGEVSMHSEQAELELRFLEETNGRVDHPSSGPVQHNDIADAMFECVYALIGEELGAFLGQALGSVGISGGLSGGTDPYARMNPNGDTSLGLGSVTGAAARAKGMVNRPAARGGMQSRNRR